MKVSNTLLNYLKTKTTIAVPVTSTIIILDKLHEEFAPRPSDWDVLLYLS